MGGARRLHFSREPALRATTTFPATLILGLGCLAVLTAPAAAQPGRGHVIIEVPRPPPNPGEISLKTEKAMPPGAGESWLTVDGAPVVRNITTPTLTPFLPSADQATGTSVIIAPGGAFMLLAIDNEGYALARWLQSRGVAAFVLKYRVRDTAPAAEGLRTELTAFERPRPAAETSAALETGPPIELATDDAEQAMLTVKARAAEWGLDANRVGFLGFSAGAMTAVNLVYRNNPATRPAFVAPLYGNVSAPARPVPDSPPPLWAAMASNDGLFGQTDFALLSAWKAKKGAVEFHLYEDGGHGFGYPGRKGTTTLHWSDAFLGWLEARGLLKKSGA